MTSPITRPPLALNARFSTRVSSGVDRVGLELTRALSDRADGSSPGHALAPDADVVSPLPLPVERGRLRGQVWEQAELPFRLKGAWLFSPCNTGPVMVSRQIVLIHDAQPFLVPEAYSLAFRLWYRLLLPLLARRARAVVTISEYSRIQLERFGVVPPGKAKVVPNGADHILSVAPAPAALSRFELTPGGYFLALGNLSPHKNLAMLMQAAAARPPAAPPLVVAGGGNSQVFADAGLAPPPGVRMLGRVTDAELRALYQNAIAFLFPSLTEGFGLPPLEAMLCDCPVIVSDAGAIPEVCGEAAVYVSPTDVAGWTRAMTEINEPPSHRAALVAAGRVRAARFTWARSAALLSDIIDDVTRGDCA